MVLQPKKIPYANTQADPENTVSQINKMLQKYGISDYQWTTQFSQDSVMLKFMLEEKDGKKIMLLFRPPSFRTKKKTWDASKGRYETLELANWASSLRFLYYRLKTKLETVAFGAIEAEQEFMADIIVKDKHGNETTLGEMLKPVIQKGLSSEDGKIDMSKALPSSAEPTER